MKNKKPIFPSLVTLESGLEITKGGYKMKQSRRVLAVLIALVMVMTMIPQNALAAKNKSKKKKYTVEISYVYSNGKKAAKTVKKSYPAGKKKVKATVNVPKKKGYTATMTKKETKKAKKLFTKFQFNGKKIKYQLNKAKKSIKIQVVYVKNKTEKTTKKKETKPADSEEDTAVNAPEEGTTAAPEEGTTAAPEEGTTAAPEEGTTAAPADEVTTQAKQDTEPAEGFKQTGKLTKTMGNSMSVDVDIPEGAFDVPVELQLNEASDDDKAKIEEFVGDYVDMALVDISFLDEDGNELEPKEGNNIDVSIKTDDLNEADVYTLYHINSNGDVEEVTPPDFEEPEVSDKVTMFSSDQFSTYAIVGSDETTITTIHYGTLDNGTFTEFSDEMAVTLDTSGTNVSIATNFEDYSYQGAVYCASASVPFANGENIGPVLKKNNTYSSGWERTRLLSETGTETGAAVDTGSHIYAVYGQHEEHPSGSGSSAVPAPTTTKTVTPNADGTYTIQIDVTGHQIIQDESHYANVLVILDATKSMNGAKWTNAKAAMKTLIETLTEGDNASNAGKIDFALVTFGRSATVVQTNNAVWTKDNAAFKSTCAGLNMVTTAGTNWEAGMRGGLYGVLNNMPDSDPTYVIFLTDGDPNVFYQSGSDTNYTDTGTTPNYGQNSNTSADHSKDEAKQIAAKTKLYGIYCGDSGTTPSGESYNRLVGVITGQGQGGVKTIAANADTIQSEFESIAETMLKDIGTSNVSVDDGITELTSVNASVAGEASGFEYYTVGSDGTATVWADAPGASYSATNGVTWDLTSVGDLPDAQTYRIKFDVWPSQESLDLIADLDNKITTLSAQDTDVLEQLQVHVDGTTYEFFAGDGKGWTSNGTDYITTAALQSRIDAATNVSYSLLTNTHLYTNYTCDGVAYTDTNNKGDNAMALDVRTFKIKKNWKNEVDSRGEDSVKLIVKQDNTNYLYGDNAIVVSGDTSPAWVSKDVFISCGYMSQTGNTYKIREEGHDYTIIEPEEYSYYWDLTANIYHPMMINGRAHLLIQDDDATGTDGADYYLLKGADGKNHKYIIADSQNVMEATNDRRSNLNLKKVVDVATTPSDDMFEYTVTMGQAGDDPIWFSAMDADGQLVTDLDTDAEAEVKEGSKTGYYSVDAGTEFTLKIAKDWNVRFINLPTGTEYTIKESDMPEFYSFVSVTAVAEKPFSDTDIKPTDWRTITDSTVTGKIIEPNNIYDLTYTNTFKAFYVYHSGVAGDGNLETEAMPENGGTYDLTQNVTDGTLYGGYYLDYAGKGDYKDDGVKGTTGVKYDGGNYTWSNPETKNGMDITPVAGETYYIKEVPSEYLRVSHFETFNSYEVWNNSNLDELYMLTAVDDENYKAVGFDDYKDASGRLDADLYKFVTIKYPGYQTPDDDVTRIDLKDIAGMNTDYYKDKQSPAYGYIAMAQKTFTTKDAFDMRAYFVTPDSIKVSGYRIKCFEIEDSNPKDGYITATIGHVKFGLAEEFKTKLYVMPRKLEYLPDSSAYKKWAEIKHKDEE